MSFLDTVQDKITNARAVAVSVANSVLGFLAFFIALAVIAPAGVSIPAEWVVYATALATALRTAVAALNPGDPSFGVGAGPTPPPDAPGDDVADAEPVDDSLIAEPNQGD